MIRGAHAAASQEAAAGAAEVVLGAGGTAVDAVIAGFLAAAGADPGVLLAPAIAIVAGFGAGARAFDGRAAQPGRGAARPRGFVDEASIPAAARVAVPRSLTMLMLLHTYRGRANLRDLARAGIAAADDAGASSRAAVIRKVGAQGLLALRAPEVRRALIAAAGSVASGALTDTDIDEAAPVEADAAALDLADGTRVFSSPFPAPDRSSAESEAIVACDGRGGLCALSYIPAREGLDIPELELRAGLDAVPVRRGVTRLAPGTILPAPAPIAILVRNPGFAVALGFAAAAPIASPRLAALAGGLPIETALADLCHSERVRAAVAVVTDGKAARGLSVRP